MDESEETARVLQKQFLQYPQMQPQDAVKLLFQNEFGSGHILSNKDEALMNLKEECSKTPFCSSIAMTEDIGNGLMRLNLASLAYEMRSANLIFKLLLHCAQQLPGTIHGFEQKIEVLHNLCARGEAPFTENLLASYLREYHSNIYAPVRHSQIYKAQYHPSYRLVRKDDMRYYPLLQNIDKQLSQGKRVVLAIDGPAASGKTTLAARLYELFDANVIHMDQFFLPLMISNPECLYESGGHIDYERLEKILHDVVKGEPIAYQIFNCCKMGYDDTVHLPPKLFNIIEGSYSMNTHLRWAYNLCVCLSISSKEQKFRIMHRNRDNVSMYLSKWIPFEEIYFKKENIKALCDFYFIND